MSEAKTTWWREAVGRCADDARAMVAGAGAAVGLGALACAACCALPAVLVALGAGGAATFAMALEPWIGAVVALVVLGLVVARVLTRRAPPPDFAPGATCATTGDCNATAVRASGACCGPRPREVYRSPQSDPQAPIVCTADLASGDLLSGYRHAFVHLVDRARFDGGFHWRFEGDEATERSLRALAEAEHGCCSFFSFHLTREGDHIVWETRARPEAASVLDAYFQLPDIVAIEPDDAAVARRFRGANLRFAADDRCG